jgi:hypothetical protein
MKPAWPKFSSPKRPVERLRETAAVAKIQQRVKRSINVRLTIPLENRIWKSTKTTRATARLIEYEITLDFGISGT